MAKILAPNKKYTGVSASVAFANGEGRTDNPHLINWFKEHGYEVVDEDSVSDFTTNQNSLSKMKKEDLKALAIELGIEVPSKAKVEDIIELIEAKQAEDKE